MPGDEREHTGPVRRLQTDPGDGWHDRLVEHFGADGRGGEWGRAMKVLDRHEVVLEDLRAWKWKLLGMASLGGIVAGILAAVIPKLIH